MLNLILLHRCLAEGGNLYRERAAYLISREMGGFGVPATVIAKIRFVLLDRFQSNRSDLSTAIVLLGAKSVLFSAMSRSLLICEISDRPEFQLLKFTR